MPIFSTEMTRRSLKTRTAIPLALSSNHIGYSQLLCRTAATLCMTLPHGCDVRSFSLIPILAVIIVAAIILNMAWIDMSLRKIMAFSIVLLPHSSEVYIHLCNLNWTASLLPCLFLFQPPLASVKDRRSLFTIVTTAILGLSSMYVTILSPLFGFRFLRQRQKTSGEIILLVTIVVTSAIQTFVVFSNGLIMSSTNDATPAFAPVFSPFITFINAIFILPFASYVTSVELLQMALHDIGIFIPTAILVTTMCLSIIYLWISSNKQARTYSLTLFGLGYYLIVACAARTANNLQLYIPMRSADRYFFLPYFFFTVALTSIIAIKNGTITRKIVSYFVIATLTIFYISEWRIIRAPEGADEIWRQQLNKLHSTGTWDFNPKNGIYHPDHSKTPVKGQVNMDILPQ